jgi:signal peptidase I
MTDSTPSHPTSTTTPTAPTWESRLPSWQQWINGFCENWIFAFIVAMAIRHFCLEAFRIPTASMEPMMYGDPAFTKADHVVVDKFFFRFTGPSRWDVTVFQFPQPEVEPQPQKDEPADARTAIAADGSRLDRVMMRPLMYRNFVKRAVILPGDTWYIAGGNIYLKQPDGTFMPSRKPKEVQDELWQEVYRFGVQPEYMPWTPHGGSNAALKDGALRFDLVKDGTVTFYAKQFRNLYMKPGVFLVSWGSGVPQKAELSMLSPQFTYNGRTGVAWDDDWGLRRMNSADLDSYDRFNPSAGTVLNGKHGTMHEYVGDVRFRMRIADLSGDVAYELSQGNVHFYRLSLSPTGWSVSADGNQIAQGTDSPVLNDLSFGILDDQLFVTLGEKELLKHDIASNDPNENKLGAQWSGTGSISFSQFSLDRDVHYSWGNEGSILRSAEETQQYLLEREREVQANSVGLSFSSYPLDKAAKSVRDVLGVRAQMLGIQIQELKGADRYRAMGNSPETALTAPPGAYLMLGDNSPQSWDSRCWGYVASENLRGRVLAVVLPMSRWRLVR